MEESGDKTNQNCVFTLTPFAVLAQQSPPSNWQPQLLRENARGISWSGVQRIVRTTLHMSRISQRAHLFSSSQLPSPLYFGNLQKPLQLELQPPDFGMIQAAVPVRDSAQATTQKSF